MNDPNAIDSLLSDMPEVLIINEIADLMRVDASTVSQWSKNYGLKIITIGPRTRRVRRADLREFLLHSDEHEDEPMD